MDIGRVLSTTSTTTTSTDGTLRAELWADAMVKILSCWIPIALATTVVGGHLLGSSLECFPLHLASAVIANPDNVNGSSTTNNVTGSPAEAFRDPRMYSNQLDEFVNVYCEKQTTFNYRLFTMMLVAQSFVMFAPHLVWNITRAREVICNLSFIRQDLEDVYKTIGPEDSSLNHQRLFEQKELTKFVTKLLDSKKIYYRYMATQVSTAILIVVFILVFCAVEPGSIYSIQDNFKCTVSKEFKFIVDCSVSAASLYRIAWWTNMCVLVLTGLTFFLHMYYLHWRLKTKPFGDVGIDISKFTDVSDQETDTSSTNSYALATDTDTYAYSSVQDSPVRLLTFLKAESITDCHLMYAFLKANIASMEKYNFAAYLHENLEIQTKTRVHIK